MNGQADFARALLDPAQACPGGLSTWNGSDPAHRFAVYRNNVTVSLIDALAGTFPVVQELVGEEFFCAMARVFVRANPPRSRVMAYYGASFADFVECFGPAASVAYLADVARLEMGRVQAYHAPDAPDGPAAIAAALQAALADPLQLASLRLALHPSVHVIESAFAICDIWAAHQGAPGMASVDPDVAQTALVFRSGLDVDTVTLSAGAGKFFRALQRQATLIEAASEAADADADFDLTTTLALLLRFELIVDITTRKPTS